MSGFVRPYDEEAVRESFSKTGALVLFLDKPIEPQFSLDANRWGFGVMFSQALAADIPKYFGEPVKIDATCWVLPARHLPNEP